MGIAPLWPGQVLRARIREAPSDFTKWERALPMQMMAHTSLLSDSTTSSTRPTRAEPRTP